MIPEHKVCSLETSKKLAALGVTKESFWKWWVNDKGECYLRNKAPTDNLEDINEYYMAYDSDEFMAMLPDKIYIRNFKTDSLEGEAYFELIKSLERFRPNYYERQSEIKYDEQGLYVTNVKDHVTFKTGKVGLYDCNKFAEEKMVEALGGLLIQLIRDGYVKVEHLNK